MSKSVREIIKEIQLEVRQSEDLLPDRAAELLAQLASLYGNVNDKIRETEFSYNMVLLNSFEREKTANRAKIKAETTNEYLEMKQARDTKELVKHLIGGLKYFLRAKEEEMRVSKYQ